MTTRADLIAAVLRRPVLRRPVLARELRERLVQGLGAGSTVAEWTATLPQLAEAIDTALIDGEVRATAPRGSIAGGHALIVEARGRDLVGACQCGTVLGRINPGTPLDALAVPWERHTAALTVAV